jgi:hypothetical protein
VRVSGKVNSEGDLTASVVIIGDVFNVKGTVVSSVNNDSIFPLLLDPGQVLIGDQVQVEVTNATMVMVSCDEEVGIEAIQRGKRARIVGKFDVVDGVFRAIAVFLKSEEIYGDLVSIGRPTGEINLTIRKEDGNELVVILPDDMPVYLQGYGEISLRLLNQIISNCGPKKVRIELDPEAIEPTAREVRVEQESLYGEVDDILNDRVVLLADGNRVKIQEGATILLNTRRADVPVDFDAIKVGDELTLYGLMACDGLDADFYAYIVLINESATDCADYDCDDGDDDDDDDNDDDDDDQEG